LELLATMTEAEASLEIAKLLTETLAKGPRPDDDALVAELPDEIRGLGHAVDMVTLALVSNLVSLHVGRLVRAVREGDETKKKSLVLITSITEDLQAYLTKLLPLLQSYLTELRPDNGPRQSKIR